MATRGDRVAPRGRRLFRGPAPSRPATGAGGRNEMHPLGPRHP